MPDTNATPLNQILYGPPGTGKTFHTVDRALQILDAGYLDQNREDRAKLKARFDEFMEAGRIGFATFHQSFSYEDFVEGLRASTNEEGQVTYEIEDGIFKRMCASASAHTTIKRVESVDLSGKRIWKMSLGDTRGNEGHIYDECIEQDRILLGYGRNIDFSDCTNRKEVATKFSEAGRELEAQDFPVTAVSAFVTKMSTGDIVVISDGNHKFRAIGEIIGNYELIDVDDRDGYLQSRDVRWIRIFEPSLPIDQLMKKQFSQMTVYELRPSAVDTKKLSALLGSKPPPSTDSTSPYYVGQVLTNSHTVASISPELVNVQTSTGSRIPLAIEMLRELGDLVKTGQVTLEDIQNGSVFNKVDSNLEKYIVNGYKGVLRALVASLVENESTESPAADDDYAESKAFVLIIDEINRGNISNIFGELITLIESSKRAGEAEALELTLPYSKEKFTVPSNLYLIGTMNTADRSLAHIDTALRRRFEFENMLPDIEVLRSLGIHEIDGVDVPEMLETMNDRIEILFDREHTLGHSFFIPLADAPSLSTLAHIFSTSVFPLLEEYFFEDWSRIRQVLGDDRKSSDQHCFYCPSFKADEVASLLGDESPQSLSEKLFHRNNDALKNPQAFISIYKNITLSAG